MTAQEEEEEEEEEGISTASLLRANVGAGAEAMMIWMMTAASVATGGGHQQWKI